MVENIEASVLEYIKRKYSDCGEVEQNHRIERLKFVADAYIQNGCHDKGLNERTIIEIKRRLYYDSLHRLSKLAKMLKEDGYNLHVIYIDAYDLSGHFIKEYENNRKTQKEKLGFTLEHVSLEQISRYCSNYCNPEQIMLWAKFDFKNNPVTLFLGAGVSQNAGLPGWSALLKELKKKAQIGSRSLKSVGYNKLCSDCGGSYIILARLLKHLFSGDGGEAKLKDVLHGILYGKYNGRNIKRERDAIDVISEWVRDKKVDSIITYNYDSLVEDTLDMLKVEADSVYKLSPPSGKFPIHHVHGFLPYDMPLLKSTPVLSEDEYHDFYNQAYNWANVEQLHALNRSTCLFIGHSLTDPNLRRLLDIAQGQSCEVSEVRHYAIMEDSEVCKHIICKSSQISYKSNFEAMMERMGVRVIWYSGYKNLPTVLDEIASK